MRTDTRHDIPLDALERPIAYHRIFRDVGGSTVAAVLLSQAWHWTKTLPPEREGWFWKTADGWEEETGLSRYEQTTARKHLKERGLLEEERRGGTDPTMWYRIDRAKLAEAIRNQLASRDAATPHQEMLECSTTRCGNTTSLHTEITTESTPESTTTPADAGTEGQLTSGEMFELFWKRYPKGRGSKKASRAQWDRLKVDATLFEQILAGLDAWHSSYEWREPQYIRYCESWLKHQLWENPPEPWTPEPPKLRDRATNHSGDDSFRRKWGLGPYAGDAPPDGVIDVEGAAR